MGNGFYIHSASIGKNVVSVGYEINIVFRKGAFAEGCLIKIKLAA